MAALVTLDAPNTSCMAEIEPIWIDWPRVKIRRNIETEAGNLARFVVQLEYDTAVGDEETRAWRVVSRFDHDQSSGGGHDVSEEGLHLDIYRDGKRYARSRNFPKLPPGDAMRYGETYLREHADRLVARFELWHGHRRTD